MNNSFIVEGIPEKKPDERKQEREAEIVKLIEALEGVQQTREWSTLQTMLFQPLADSLEQRSKSEAERPELNTAELYRLQGERRVVRKYDLPRQISNLRAEIAAIRKQSRPPQGNGEM